MEFSTIPPPPNIASDHLLAVWRFWRSMLVNGAGRSKIALDELEKFQPDFANYCRRSQSDVHVER
jgi:hypothetical protein